MSTFECVFTNSQRPVVDCLTVAAGILARSQGEVIKETGADRRFVKTLSKMRSVTLILINSSSYLLSDSYMTNTTTSNQDCIKTNNL